MNDKLLKEIEKELEVCVPVHYNQIDYENIAPECHEDWEPSKELEKKLDEFNSYLKNLKPHSWTTGKVRTIYTIHPDNL